MKLSLFLIITFCLAALSLQAQETPSVNLKFKIANVGKVDWKNIYYQTPNGAFVPLKFFRHRRSSKVYEYTGPQQIHFYRFPDSVPVAPEPIPAGTHIASLTATKSLDEALLIFVPQVPTEESAAEFKIFMMDDSQRTFPKNSLILFNSLAKTVYAQVGEAQIQLEPGFSQPIDYPRKTSDRFKIKVLINTQKGPRFAYENRVEFEKETRTLFIFKAPGRGESLRLKTKLFIEHIEAESVE